MNGRKLSAALTALPEDMVAEAMEPGCNGRSFSWLRLAVCAVIVLGLFVGFWPTQPEIVTAPGLLTVTVYAMDDTSDTGMVTVDLEEGVKCPIDFSWNLGISRYPGLPISLSLSSDDYPLDEITFEVSVSRGKYFEWGKYTEFRFSFLPSEFTQSNFTTIYWSPVFSDEYWLPEFDHIYTNILIKCEDHIIGYSILRFDRHMDPSLSDTYDPVLIVSKMFPKINGEYQNVPYEYVQTIFAEKE